MKTRNQFCICIRYHQPFLDEWFFIFLISAYNLYDRVDRRQLACGLNALEPNYTRSPLFYQLLIAPSSYPAVLALRRLKVAIKFRLNTPASSVPVYQLIYLSASISAIFIRRSRYLLSATANLKTLRIFFGRTIRPFEIV